MKEAARRVFFTFIGVLALIVLIIIANWLINRSIPRVEPIPEYRGWVKSYTPNLQSVSLKKVNSEQALAMEEFGDWTISGNLVQAQNVYLSKEIDFESGDMCALEDDLPELIAWFEKWGYSFSVYSNDGIQSCYSVTHP